jgi:hypothetical protein
MNQKDYFQKLTEKTFPQNLQVSVVYYNSKVEKYTPGKRYNAEKYETHDDRNIGENEVVWDFDFSSYKHNYQKARAVSDALKNRRIGHLICATGGKGIHIHCFFNRLVFKGNEGKELFKEAVSYQLSYKDIRLWLWSTILDEAGIQEEMRKKHIDPKVLKFNYFNGTTHLIRDIGGRKYTQTPEGEWQTHYKTWIPDEEFSVKKINITNIDAVKYPETIPTFDIDEADLTSFLKEFVDSAKKQDVRQLTVEKIDGKYLELDAMLKVREGLQEGNRNVGAQLIAVAAKLDKLTKEQAYEIAAEYVKNCSQAGSEFSILEAQAWVDWIYNQPFTYWNCGVLNELGVHERSLCAHCTSQNKDALDFLSKSNMLDQIKDALDLEIVGESAIKVLVFLLSLSKDFPSKSGNPDFYLPFDTMSQNIVISSDSSSGKTYLVKQVLSLFGEKDKDYFVVSRMTKNAINYMTEVNMDGKIIFIEELQGLDENTQQLRVWMSEGEVSLNTVEKIKDAEGNEVNKMVNKTTKGQPVFITTQAEGKVEEQLLNRGWVLSMDISTPQTKNILAFQDSMAKRSLKLDPMKKRKIVEALKQLKPYHFIVPYANYEALELSTEDVRTRRDYRKFLALIQCSAYLHQQQRLIIKDKAGNEFIVCAMEDYEVARTYSKDILGATFSGLTQAQLDLINFIRTASWKDEFMISDIMRNLGKSQTHWYGAMSQLEDLGFVTSQKQVGKSSIYSIVDSKVSKAIAIPNAEQLLSKIGSTYSLLIENLLKGGYEILREYRSQGLGAPVLERSSVTDLRGISPETQVTATSPKLPDLLIKRSFEPNIVFQSESRAFLETSPVPTRTELAEYLKKHNEHMVPFDHIIQKFKLTEEQFQAMMAEYKKDGTVFEPKAGRLMLL